MGLQKWTYEGKRLNRVGERLVVESEPGLKASEESTIAVTIGNKTIWMTTEQAEELRDVLQAMRNARMQLS